MWIVGED